MKTIIAGGRDYNFTEEDFALLERVRCTITEVVSGCATGADTWAIGWAVKHEIPVARFPAQWDDLSHPHASIRVNRHTGKKYDATAGFRRNEEMAKYARGGQCILFPGAGGTQHMAEEAAKRGLRIIDWRTTAGRLV